MKKIIFTIVVVLSVVAQASSLDESNSSHLFRLEVKNSDNLEGAFRGEIPGENFNRSEDRFDIYFTLSNDLSLLRVFKIVPKDDDFGYTHGYTFSAGQKLESDHYIRFEYSSDLYTRPVNVQEPEAMNDKGELIVKQYFVNDNMARIILDNMNEGKMFYWRGELGWEKLDNRPTKNVAAASRQQEILHDFLNGLDSGTTKKPVYVTETPSTSEGLILGAYAGLQRYFKPNHSICSYGARVEAGHRLNQIQGADYSEASAYGSAVCEHGNVSYRLDSGVKEQYHQDGRQEKTFVDISIGIKTWRVGLKVEKIKGDLHNYMQYNVPNIKTGENDSTTSLYLHKKF